MSAADELKKLEDVKASVKASVGSIDEADELRRFLWNEISKPVDSDFSNSLRTAVLIIHLLLLDKKQRSLVTAEINKLKQLFYAVVAKLKLGRSKEISNTLFHDFHLALSQLHWADQSWFASQWEQGIAARLSSEVDAAAIALDCVAFGLRAFRLGHGHMAIAAFNQVPRASVNQRTWLRAKLTQSRVLRLIREFNAAKEILNLLEEDAATEPDMRLELEWEAALLHYTQSREIKKLKELIDPGKPHRQSRYIIEYFLNGLAHPDAEVVDDLPTLRTFVNQKIIIPAEAGEFYDAVRLLLDCYRSDENQNYLVQRIGEMLDAVANLSFIEDELLVWVASFRWLHRNEVSKLAEIARLQYQAKSLILTDGKSTDTLGLLNVTNS